MASLEGKILKDALAETLFHALHMAEMLNSELFYHHHSSLLQLLQLDTSSTQAEKRTS